jgi:hypothetical protein
VDWLLELEIQVATRDEVTLEKEFARCPFRHESRNVTVIERLPVSAWRECF